MNKKLKLSFFIAALLFPAALSALDFKIRVYDPIAGKGVEDATVVIFEVRKKYSSEEGGYVDASVPQAGFYTFRVILPGGSIKQLRFNVQSEGQTIEILTSKRPDTGTGKTTKIVDAESGTLDIVGKKKKTKLSRYQVRLDEIKRMPGTFGEALRGLETLPGINAPAFGDGSIIVRGANSNANTYLVDDLPIGYAFHFFGVNSVIHNDIISTIDIYTGSFPANFYNATGGVVEIETINEVEKFGGHASFSMLSANLLLKAPVLDKQGYWIAAARGSYMERTLKPYIPDGVRAPQYGDAQFKINYNLNPYNALTFYALGAKDSFAAAVKSRQEWDPTEESDPIFDGASIALDQAFYTTGLRHTWRLKPAKSSPAPGTEGKTDKTGNTDTGESEDEGGDEEEQSAVMSNVATVYYFNNIFFIDGTIGNFDALQKLETGYTTFKDVFNWDIYNRGPNQIALELGLEGRTLHYKNNGTTLQQIDPFDEFVDPFDTVNPDFVQVPVRDSVQTSTSSGYMMTTLKFGGTENTFTDGAGWNVEFKPGFRVDYFGLSKHRVVDPRGTLSFTLHKTTLIGGAGVYHRNPDPQQFSNSTGNPDLRMERAEHYGGGIEQLIGDWTIKVEAYRHYFTDIVVVDPYIKTAVRANNHVYERYQRPWLYNDPLRHSNDGTGFSEGFEVYIKRSKEPKVNGWYGWISYSQSKTLRNDHQHIVTEEEKKLILSADERRALHQYDNTKDIFADFDRKHIINIVFGYKITRNWQVGARWKYQSSAPYTPIIKDNGGRRLASGRILFDPELSTLTNSGRVKPYHSLDIRIDRFLHYGWGFGNVFFELFNVYLRENTDGISWDRSRPISLTNPSSLDSFNNLEVPSGKGKETKIPLFNFGVEIKF